MLNEKQIECAVAMIGRAELKGHEAPLVTETLQALVECMRDLKAPKEETNDDDSGTD
jgi:hypothetical protein